MPNTTAEMVTKISTASRLLGLVASLLREAYFLKLIFVVLLRGSLLVVVLKHIVEDVVITGALKAAFAQACAWVGTGSARALCELEARHASTKSRLTLTIASVAIAGLLGVLLGVVLQVEHLSQVPVEFAETILILLVEEHALHVFVLVQALVKFVQKVRLHVPALGFGSPIAFIEIDDEHRRGLGFRRSEHLE
mmetsp:Transcript_29528/g.39281  ORF Transcript_29528/g.39281 Transcript_29528/m.39281 type:complete len:194 (+) Transcript_29528:2094-2675(+)